MFSALKLFAFATLATASPLIVKRQAAAREYFEVDNISYNFNDIGYFYLPFDRCGPTCDATPGCVAFTIHKDNGANCWLKTKADNRVADDRRRSYTIKQPTRNYIQNVNIDSPSEQAIAFHNGPFESCRDMCDNTPGCNVYILKKEDGQGCWLLTAPTTFHANGNRDTYVVEAMQPKPKTYLVYTNMDVISGYVFDGAMSRETCEATCNGRSDCNAYIWDKSSGNYCWLKGGLDVPAVATAARDTYAVPTAPGKTYRNIDNFDFNGNDFGWLDVPESQCNTYCDNMPGCVGYSYMQSGKGCSLKYKLENPTYKAGVSVRYVG